VDDAKAGSVAVDYFLKIDGIDGESLDAKHKGAIELESFNWGESNPVSPGPAGAGRAGRVQAQDLTVVMRMSKASPLLFLACAEGQHIKDAVLSARRGGKAQKEFLVVTLKSVLVSSYTTSGGGGEAPVDQVSFSFASIEIEYSPQKPNGSLDLPVKAGWDLVTNRKI
jgi:type VI secretion system secreted protein Hcp